MMIGDTKIRERAAREPMRGPSPSQCLSLPASSPTTTRACRRWKLDQPQGPCEGEIVGIAGVSGNGQSELVEVLSGQREGVDVGRIFVRMAKPSSRRAISHGQVQGVLACRRSRLQERRRAAA